jgi:hypothetical protein
MFGADVPAIAVSFAGENGFPARFPPESALRPPIQALILKIKTQGGVSFTKRIDKIWRVW